MDVCPVGAITTRDYRFKSRPWDNPHAVDTICTLCEKGCNTTAWIKAKPEWAKGAQLIRMTPRLNPEVNSYWMCDIGRFDYHWVEGDRRLRQPHVRQRAVVRRSAVGRRARRGERRRGRGGRTVAVRFFVSAHASLEELFVLRQISAGTGGVTLGWRHREKPQPKTQVQDSRRRRAERARRARPGLRRRSGHGPGGCVEAARGRRGRPRQGALRVRSGPGRIDRRHRLDRRGAPGRQDQDAHRAGRPDTPLADAADIVLPGSAFVEKDATYTNMTGHVQAASRVIPPPGDAGEDWQILTKLGIVFGANVSYASAAAVREAIAPSLATSRATRRSAPSGSRGRCPPALAAGLESVGAVEVGLHVPGPAADQVRRGLRSAAARGSHSAQGSEVRDIDIESRDSSPSVMTNRPNH